MCLTAVLFNPDHISRQALATSAEAATQSESANYYFSSFLTGLEHLCTEPADGPKSAH